MAVQSRELHAGRRFRLGLPTMQGSVIVYTIAGVIIALAVYVLLSQLFSMVRVVADDLQYGRPRTFHLTAHVGRPEEVGVMTHLIAMNLDRQVMILELPGGDATKIRVLPGPYLFGAGEDLTPVTMRLADMNGDGAADLMVRVKNEEMVYLNREGGFSLITAEERQQLAQ
jgi:hypothetical protein